MRFWPWDLEPSVCPQLFEDRRADVTHGPRDESYEDRTCRSTPRFPTGLPKSFAPYISWHAAACAQGHETPDATAERAPGMIEYPNQNEKNNCFTRVFTDASLYTQRRQKEAKAKQAAEF